ncbi:uncharacterized protein LOC114364710 isoform X1 [Ostrinia furnacalis]|uniref:uncharacterized protein LOC114364710 isoform X1 n=1 Tax=Ostrinia furnacalis TaxID=93504 RepID=UPI001038EEB3|nr:uncharacterized protein LOC114364710 isoform X1 [Ostrinia furnacalis]
MTSRGRSNNNNEWDLMRDEYNNSSYDPQYPDDNVSGGVQLDHCRLYIRNIPNALNEDGIRTAFSKYGNLHEVYVSKDPAKKYALVRYETPGEAKLAMTKLNNTDPLRLNITIAHKNKNSNSRDNFGNGPRRNNRDDNASASSRERSFRRHDDMINGEDMDETAMPTLDDDLDPETKMKGIQLELQRLKVQEQSMMLQQQLLQLEAARKKNVGVTQSIASNRCILPDGRIVVRNVNDRNLESRDVEGSFAAGAGDSNERETVCSCKTKLKRSWDQASSEGSSTPSTCVLCSEDSRKDRLNQAKSVASKYTEISKKSDYSSRFDKTTDLSRKSVASKTTDVKSELSKTDTVSKRSDVTSKKLDVAHKRGKSEITCDLKYSDFYSDSEDEADETNRLIQLRNCDYMDIVGDSLKVVIALAGYPKSKMRLRQMQLFQRCLTDVIDMQLKANLLKKVPVFLDYYLNRGAIVCICKDLDTRDWMVRISPGLQERMCTNLILLKAKVKRLCLAVLKIPQSCWPATAQDAFKLLQYFNPTLKTDQWKIYSQKNVDSVECTSFLIDRVSGEIIRGPTFKNVIDYNQTEFELTGYTEIYYECLLSDLEDICSVASRVKLLEELRSEEATPRNIHSSRAEVTQKSDAVEKAEEIVIQHVEEVYDNDDSDVEIVPIDDENVDRGVKDEFENNVRNEILKKLKDVKYISDKDEVIVWSDEANNYNSDQDEREKIEEITEDDNNNITATSAVAVSDKTESIIESNENLISRSSNLNIDSNRGIAYHRRTNYLHVENELKVAITLEGYPQNKLEGTHIRRLKHLFKEYLHKDMKMQRFANLIIPKFQDIYLSNGAVIYICDSLETKDYLTEVLPKFINSTGLKLTFRDIKNLVRYTRVVLRLPKEHAHVESVEILLKLQAKYPGLKPDCWKYYSDVAGKQKRQFGVDPESLDVIKSPDFDPTYEGEKLSFRIIDRQKRDVSFEDSYKDDNVDDNDEGKQLRDKVLKMMYAPIDPEITNTPLTRIRTNHYSDLIADDLKLYVGPSNYPETRVDEVLFHSIKRTFENIVCDAYEKGVFELPNSVPTFHDMYLFDGVIFIICQNMNSREWMENSIPEVNERLHINLKSTEFRGAVGIISMVVKTDKDTDVVIEQLQKQNPRLRTKYWRKISTVRAKTKLDVVLQIDKLSAQVITKSDFNKFIDGNPVQFKLGHLQSLLRPKASLEELTKMHLKKMSNSNVNAKGKKKEKEMTIEELKSDLKRKYPDLKIDQWDVISQNEADIKVCKYEIDESSQIVETPTKETYSGRETVTDPNTAYSDMPSPTGSLGRKNVVIKIPSRLLPDNKEDLNMVFDLLEDKNPGLNTELWKVYTDSSYPGNGRFTLVIDRQSASVIQGKSFNPNIGGEKLKFFF